MRRSRKRKEPSSAAAARWRWSGPRCWALAARREPRPTFQEYLFFFDYLIQNGDSFTERSALQTVILTMQFDKESVAAKDDALVRQKMIQLKEWLEAGFKNMRNAGAARDHADYARENAARWMARFNEGAITKDQVRLAYVGLMRAMLGNNQWAYAAMNRRGTIAFGNGVVNGQDYSAQSMRELMDGAGRNRSVRSQLRSSVVDDDVRPVPLRPISRGSVRPSGFAGEH